MTSPEPIQYKGEELRAERGPGLGCFRFQLVVLAVAIVLTPLSQSIIFLLRLVAADRRTRRRPLGSVTKTVGEIEDDAPEQSPDEAAADVPDPDPSDEGPVRQ